jgi:hypothetical protein
VHTASPRAASSSISVPPQPRHTRPVMVRPPGPPGRPAPRSSARGPQPAEPRRSAPHSREAASTAPADSRQQIRQASPGRSACNGRADGIGKGTRAAAKTRGLEPATSGPGRRRTAKQRASRPLPRRGGGGTCGAGRGWAVSSARDGT